MIERWRYACSECGSVQVRKRRSLSDVKEVRNDRRYRTYNTSDKHWYCEACQTALDHVLDKKTGGRRSRA